MRYLISVLALFALGFSGCDESFSFEPTADDGSTGDGGSDVTVEDDDGDGLSNSVEDEFEIEKLKADTDHDGFSDGIEFVGDLGDPADGSASPTPFRRKKILLVQDALQNERDGDQDGLGDTFETDNEMNPDSPDMDGDGYQDGLELVANADPFRESIVPVREAPPASDGVTRTGAAPQDSDNDGIADNVETLNGTKSTTRDSDGDGFSDGIEFLMGSDGADFLSIPNFSVPNPPTDTSTTTTTVETTSTTIGTTTTTSSSTTTTGLIL